MWGNVIKSRYELGKGFLLCGSISSTVVNTFIKSSTIPFSRRKVPHLRFTRIVPQAQEKYFSLLHGGENNFLDFSWRVTLRGPGSRYTGCDVAARYTRSSLYVVSTAPALPLLVSSYYHRPYSLLWGLAQLRMKTLQNDDLLWQRNKAVTCNNQTQSKLPDCKLW